MLSASDVLLSHMITFLNDKVRNIDRWHLVILPVITIGFVPIVVTVLLSV